MFYPSLSERLHTQHQALPQLIQPLTQEQLLQQPRPGTWSIQENLAHLVSYQPQFLSRLHRILDTPDPLFERYVGDEDPVFLYWRRQSADTLLHELEADRQQIIALLQGLRPEQLQRTGTHMHYGRLTVQDWTEFFLLHEAHHLFTIFKLAHKR
ncbi:DinB family protein [Chitinophaga japonensis]|uniref:DinB family protein n=1 Tax=Chitinophaga japonensis TaxID=104662 RepID=A0A562STY1_CHIJA|nr:DinB family protein [Chitinophaga japonensis]TWI84170.1 DinB family protein [Chitinophaga japonensis]